MANRKKLNGEIVAENGHGGSMLPFEVGEIIRRLRMQRGLSIRDVADGCGLSQSFLSMMERGDSDISLGRLAKIAAYFEHDIGSLLGYTSRLSKPRYLTNFERAKLDRGDGIDFEAIRLPGLEFELAVVKLNPHRGYKDAIVHEGFDVAYVFKGDVILCLGDDEYPMREGDCVYYSATQRHRIVNRSNRSATLLGVTTGRMASSNPAGTVPARKKKMNGRTAGDRTKGTTPKPPFDVGEILHRLRTERGLSVREVAEACGISGAFLSLIERGESDISIVRLAKLADFFGHDIGSLLGYSSRLSKPVFITKASRTKVNRGPGIDYEVIRLPSLDFELNVMRMNANRGYKDALVHEGFDIIFAFQGDVVLSLADEEYVLHESDWVYYSAAYRHRLINRSNRNAIALAITTGHMG